MLKCIWSNWINQKDADQTFKFPSVTGDILNVSNTDPTQEAKLSHLKQLYYNERENIAKLAPTLSYKSLSFKF
jgi:hypothetical protein